MTHIGYLVSVDAEGCFYIRLENSSNKTNVGGLVRLRLYVTQHIRDIELLKNLVCFLGCGQYYERWSEKPVGDYIVTNFKDICEKIIPFFDKYPLQGAKFNDFADFKRVAELMENKAHLNESLIKDYYILRAQPKGRNLNNNKINEFKQWIILQNKWDKL